MTTTRLPLARDSAACSAWSRQTITVKNDAEQLGEVRMEHTELVAPGVAHDPEVQAALLLMVIAGRAQRLQALDLGLNIVLIAHNPGIQDLALALAAGGPALAGLREKFPTGALAGLELDVERWPDLDHGTATATTVVTPRSLESRAEA